MGLQDLIFKATLLFFSYYLDFFHINQNLSYFDFYKVSKFIFYNYANRIFIIKYKIQ